MEIILSVRSLALILFLFSSLNCFSQEVLVVGFEKSAFKSKLASRYAKKNKVPVSRLHNLVRETMTKALASDSNSDMIFTMTSEQDTITKYLWKSNRLKSKRYKKKKTYSSLVLNESTNNALRAYFEKYDTDYVLIFNRYSINEESGGYLVDPNGGAGTVKTSIVHYIDYDVFNKSQEHITGGRHSMSPTMKSKFIKMTNSYQKMGRKIVKEINNSQS